MNKKQIIENVDSNKRNKEIYKKAVKLYFQGGNWHKYLKEQVKKDRKENKNGRNKRK